jgi:outer membrane lipoprotein-sorting protein
MGAGLGMGGATAQTAKAPATPEWSQTVTKEPGPAAPPGELDAKQIEIVQKLTAYFNEMGDMKGEFQQISPDGKRLRGYIYIKRPSSFRFEYRRPSRQLIISDGKSMIVQDLDLKTDDRYGLDQTPFRIVLKKDVDLLRDARILEVGESEDRIQLMLQDPDPKSVGRLRLLFLKTPTADPKAPAANLKAAAVEPKAPAVELKEWVTIDSQGLETRVELSDFAKVEGLDEKLFVPLPVALQKLQQ